MCFVWISEQTAIISLYSINWLVCITETESVYCALKTGSLYIIQVTCFVWIWEQTAIIFITETGCVYCAVRTRSLYIIQVMCFVWISEQTAIISLYSINWLVFPTERVCLLRGTDWAFIYSSGESCVSVSPCQYHSTNAPHSSSSTCCSYQKDKPVKPGNLPKAMLFRKAGSVG